MHDTHLIYYCYIVAAAASSIRYSTDDAHIFLSICYFLYLVWPTTVDAKRLECIHGMT